MRPTGAGWPGRRGAASAADREPEPASRRGLYWAYELYRGGRGHPMSDVRRGEGVVEGLRPGGGSDDPAEVLARVGGPLFVDRRPGQVRVACRGVTGVGPDRAAALRALAERLRTAAES